MIFFFFYFLEGNFAGDLAGIFWGDFRTHKIKAQNIRGKFRSIFRGKFRGSKKIFRANFVLQLCHPKTSRCPKFPYGDASSNRSGEPLICSCKWSSFVLERLALPSGLFSLEN